MEYFVPLNKIYLSGPRTEMAPWTVKVADPCLDQIEREEITQKS